MHNFYFTDTLKWLCTFTYNALYMINRSQLGAQSHSFRACDVLSLIDCTTPLCFSFKSHPSTVIAQFFSIKISLREHTYSLRASHSSVTLSLCLVNESQALGFNFTSRNYERQGLLTFGPNNFTRRDHRLFSFHRKRTTAFSFSECRVTQLGVFCNINLTGLLRHLKRTAPLRFCNFDAARTVYLYLFYLLFKSHFLFTNSAIRCQACLFHSLRRIDFRNL